MSLCVCVVHATRDREAPWGSSTPFLPPFPALETTGRAPRGPGKGPGRAAGSAEVPRVAWGSGGAARPPAPRCAQLHPLQTPSSCALLSSAGPGRMFILRNVNTGSGVL